MRSILTLGILAFAVTFCGLGDRIKQMSGGTSSDPGASNTSSSNSSDGDSSAETASLTSSQQTIADGGTDAEWGDQNITFRVPAGWPKMDVKKESFNYGSPANGFLIASISVMPDSFPAEISIKATYDSALEQLKQGKYEKVRWLEIDGVKGVEWVESAPEEKGGIRRHQWIAFRRYQGQDQQLNFMVSTNGNNFEKQRDTFTAILYSTKIAKG